MARIGAEVTELETLVARAQAGDQRAYETIVRRFQDMAVGYAYSLLGDIHWAEDAAQEAFLNAYRDLAALREPAAFPGWLRQIVFKHVNRMSRRKRVSTVALEQAADARADTPPPDELVVHREMRHQLYDAVAALPEKQREAIMLFYMGDYSQKEIGAFLEVPVSSVKMRLYTARQRLKETYLLMIQDQLQEQRPSLDDAFTDGVMTLFNATKQGDIHAVKQLLQRNNGLATASGFADSPLWQADAPALHMAVMYGRKDIIDLLLDHGADINEREEKFYFTPLHQALDLADFLPAYRALDMPAFLLERGAKHDVFSLLWSREKEAAKELVRADPSVVNQLGPGRLPPLCYAHKVALAEFFLAHGADMFMPLPREWPHCTPIQATKGDVLRFLLKRAEIEIDVFLACKLGDTEHVLAQLDAVPTLTTAHTSPDHVLGADFTLLHLAVKLGNVTVVQRLLDLGADINARAFSLNDMTPLHMAVRCGPKRMRKPFPEKMEDIQQGGVYMLLPDMPRLLLENGADVTARESEHNLTPLGLAESNLEDETDRRAVIALLKGFRA